MRVKDFLRTFSVGLAMTALVLAFYGAGYGQNNKNGKGSPGGSTPPSSGITESLTMSQANTEMGGTEVVLAVVKNTSSETGSFEINTSINAPDSNGGPLENQTNTISLNPGQSFTQNIPMMPTTAGEYSVVSNFSVNGVFQTTMTGTFQVIQ
ncbi:MAG TPA: hypothetical protein VI756_18750 [Blastocatellia bacterium]